MGSRTGQSQFEEPEWCTASGLAGDVARGPSGRRPSRRTRRFFQLNHGADCWVAVILTYRDHGLIDVACLSSAVNLTRVLLYSSWQALRGSSGKPRLRQKLQGHLMSVFGCF